MSHRDYTEMVETQAEMFDAADETLTTAAIAALEGTITMEEAEAIISGVVTTLNESSAAWVDAVLPAVVADAAATASGRFPSLPADDAGEQQAALELASLELTETLANTAEQMARDARRQIRDGLRVRMEEEVSQTQEA